jgi:N-acetylglucosaminyl-diphospho-decaprenol L-rhamnosyltransferase
VTKRAPSVHVVIVNWNTGGYLRECLASIAEADPDGVTISRVTVVDNASSDNSAGGLEDTPFPLEVVLNADNIGFAAACNQGAAGSAADYLLFLNPDTRLFPETLATVTRFMESEESKDVGICGVEIVDGEGRPEVSCARFPDLRVFFGRITGLDALLPRMFPSYHLTPGELRESRLVDQVIGAFFFVRRELFSRLGGFDSRYFMYFEEVDFALRARREGVGSYFLKEASAFHAENVSSDQVRGRRLYYSLRSRLLFVDRHWSPWKAAALFALTFTVEPVARLTRAAVGRNRREVATVAEGYRRLAGDLLGGLRRRGPGTAGMRAR